MDITTPTFPVRYRLRLALELAEIEPDEAARRLGVHPNTIANYLAGRTRPKRMALAAIAQLTDVPLWWLEGYEDEDAFTAAVTLRQLAFPFAA